MNKILKYISYEYLRSISIVKYTIAIIVFSISISISINSILNIVKANAWDIIFVELAQPRNTCVLFLFAYVIFIDNLLIDYELEGTILLKVESRAAWWNSKVIVLLSKTILFIFIPTFIISIIGILKYPISSSWSKFMLEASSSGNILKTEALSNTPFSLFIQIIGLMLLSYFTIGLIVFVTTLISNSRIIGLITGILLWIITIIPVFALTNSPIGLVSFYHIYINSHKFISSSQNGLTIMQSTLYWAGLIVLMYTIGYYVSLKRDFIGVRL